MNAAAESDLDEFLKETILTIEVAITDTPRQSDAGAKREKFEGLVVYTTTVTETEVKIREQVEEEWYIAWNVTVPISKYSALT